MSIYSWYENAATQSTLGDTDTFMVYPAGVGPPKILTSKTLQTASGGALDTTATTLTVTQALHGGRTVTISSAAPIAITLPQATGTGTTYKFQIQVAATGTSHTISHANATDVMQGVAWALTTASANVVGYGTTATSNTISLNGTTLGGVVGDIVEITDVKTGFFSVKLFTSPTGTTATPVSHT